MNFGNLYRALLIFPLASLPVPDGGFSQRRPGMRIINAWLYPIARFSNLRQTGVVPTIVNAAPIYGPDSMDASLSLQGQSAEGVPTGTTVYAGSRLEGSNSSAELLFGATPEDLAIVPDTQTQFRLGSTAGFWIARRVGLPAIPAGVPYYLKVRVWDNQEGKIDSWEKVVADPSVLRGESLLITTYKLENWTGWPTLPA